MTDKGLHNRMAMALNNYNFWENENGNIDYLMRPATTCLDPLAFHPKHVCIIL